MRRLCIYLIYDKHNTVDNYVGYMLKELKICVDQLVVVCNMPQIDQGLHNITSYADQYFLRENIGLDIGGFKDALCKLIGWEEIEQYDQLVLANDSFFGPFIPFKAIFDEMEQRGLDFWGLTKHARGYFEDGRQIPEHIQSFFTVVSSAMLHSKAFKEYWNGLPYFTAIRDAIERHEVRFTEYFHELGYQYDVYADMQSNDSINLKNNYVQFDMLPYELMSMRKFPFLKKSAITLNTLDVQTQEEFVKAINYINVCTEYNVNMIWDNIVRTLNIADLYYKFCLNFVMDMPCTDVPIPQTNCEIAVIVRYKEATEYVFPYLEQAATVCAIKIFSDSNELLKRYEQAGYDGYYLTEGYALNDIVSCLNDQKFWCIIHDMNVTSYKTMSCTGKSVMEHIWGSLLGNAAYIKKIEEKFESDKYLGVLFPTEMSFGPYIGMTVRKWNRNFENTREMVERLDLRCNLSVEKQPVSISSDLWVRGKLVKDFVSNCGEISFEKMSYLWCYIAQNYGFYSGTVQNSKIACMDGINRNIYLGHIFSCAESSSDNDITMKNLDLYIQAGRITLYRKNFKKCYVYGTGNIAQKYNELFQDITAYIVSDGVKKKEEFNHKPVMYFSEIAPGDDICIVICMGREKQMQVIPKLKERKISNYLCIS